MPTMTKQEARGIIDDAVAHLPTKYLHNYIEKYDKEPDNIVPLCGLCAVGTMVGGMGNEHDGYNRCTPYEASTVSESGSEDSAHEHPLGLIECAFENFALKTNGWSRFAHHGRPDWVSWPKGMKRVIYEACVEALAKRYARLVS